MSPSTRGQEKWCLMSPPTDKLLLKCSLQQYLLENGLPPLIIYLSSLRVTKQSFPDHPLLPWWTVLVFPFLGIHNNGCRAWQALPFNPAHSEYLCYLPDCWRQPAGYLAYLNLSTKSLWWWNRLRTLPHSSVLETAPPVQISKTSWVFSWETNISFPATEDPTWPIACQRTKLVLFAYRGEQWTCSPTPSPSWAEVRISGLRML